MSVINNGLLLGAGADGYQISRSVRLRSSASAYFNRTPASAGNRKTWTWSGWVKRGTLGTRNIVIQAEAGGNTNAVVEFNSSDQLRFFQQVGGVDTFYLTTTQVFRDPSAWYHLMVVLDTTQATNTNRMKIYVNGVQITSFSSSLYPSQNFNGSFNNNVAQYIGTWLNVPAYFDGYHTEINFIDGQALTPSSFGETDTTTGVWKPKKYTGTYGTNGFYLNFSDNSGATATTIGKDYSGNGNNWTPNNISVTAGATYDSMLDVPTPYADGGNGRGNYCTLNPLTAWRTTKPTNGNMEFASGSAAFALGTMLLPSGKWYCEVKILGGTNEHNIGFVNLSSALTSSFPATTTIRGSNAFALYTFDGKFYDNGTASAVLATFATNDIVMLAYDADNSKIYVGRNGTWLNSAVPTSGTGAVSTTATAPLVVAAQYDSGTATGQQWNFGQRAFDYTPPSGFVALNTQNLPTPTISNGANYMNASLWTGDASTPRAVVSNLSFSPDLVWTKDRSVGYQHSLQDTVRGTGASKKLYSSLTEAENGANSVYGHINSFDANGFTVATGSSGAQHVNASGVTYVGWSWKAGGTAVSNTSGSITSSVSAGATQGFSVVTFAGASTQGATVGHGLGVAPKMVIAKNRTAAQNWWVYHVSLGYANNIILNSTAASAADANTWRATPSSTVITIGDNFATGSNYVAYCFAEVAGYSKFGSYIGNGSADGVFVYCGFRPRFIMIKRTDTTSNWVMWDTTRDTYNASGLGLYPNLSAAEDDYRSSNPDDILSNGFKLRANYANVNASNGTYIFMAVAENPFKLSLAR